MIAWGALTAVFSCAKAGPSAALANPTFGLHTLPMRATAVDRFIALKRRSSLSTIASTPCTIAEMRARKQTNPHSIIWRESGEGRQANDEHRHGECV